MQAIRITTDGPILIRMKRANKGDVLEVGKDVEEQTARLLVRRGRAVVVEDQREETSSKKTSSKKTSSKKTSSKKEEEKRGDED